MSRIIFLLLLFIVKPCYGYVYGYSRLYCEATKTTIDILYDVHIKEKLSVEDFQNLPLAEIKSRLYPTEQRVVQALEKLNASDHVVVIWESSPSKRNLPNNAFIGYANRLIGQSFQHLNYIAADTWRHDVPGITELLYDDSLLNLVDKDTIINHYGSDVLGALEKYSSEIFKAHVHDFRHHRELMKDLTLPQHHPYNFSPFSALADIEMLSHILCSIDNRIILYAGGEHAANVQRFLEAYVGFKRVYSFITLKATELDPGLLAPLEGETVSCRARLAYLLSNYSNELQKVCFLGSLGVLLGIVRWLKNKSNDSYRSHTVASVLDIAGYYFLFCLIEEVRPVLFPAKGPPLSKVPHP